MLEGQRLLPHAAQVLELEARVGQALDEAVDLPNSGRPPQRAIQAVMGSLARDTLAYLAAHRPDLAPSIHRAVAMMSDPLAGPSRFDPHSIGVGLVAVLALQSDLHQERVNNGNWRLTPHKKALSDTALPTLVSKFLNTYTAGGS